MVRKVWASLRRGVESRVQAAEMDQKVGGTLSKLKSKKKRHPPLKLIFILLLNWTFFCFHANNSTFPDILAKQVPLALPPYTQPPNPPFFLPFPPPLLRPRILIFLVQVNIIIVNLFLYFKNETNG